MSSNQKPQARRTWLTLGAQTRNSAAAGTASNGVDVLSILKRVTRQIDPYGSAGRASVCCQDQSGASSILRAVAVGRREKYGDNIVNLGRSTNIQDIVVASCAETSSEGSSHDGGHLEYQGHSQLLHTEETSKKLRKRRTFMGYRLGNASNEELGQKEEISKDE